jgi:hypothetical protein
VDALDTADKISSIVGAAASVVGIALTALGLFLQLQGTTP